MITRFNPGARLSGATAYGDFVFVSGQVPDDLSAGMDVQAQQVLAKIDDLLAQAGTDKSNILSAMIWLPDIGDFAAFNSIWDAWVPAGAAPARACVESRLARAGMKVEIGCIAVRSQGTAAP